MRTLPFILVTSLIVVGAATIAGGHGDAADSAAIVGHVFEMSDLDENGALTLEEYLELYRKHHDHAAASGREV